MTIHPTRTCFDDASELLIQYAADPQERRRVRLVHAICHDDSVGTYSHAWIELDGQVIWVGIVDGQRKLFTGPIGGYYKKFGVSDTTKYTFEAALQLGCLLGVAPWRARYKALCRDRKPAEGNPTWNKSI